MGCWFFFARSAEGVQLKLAVAVQEQGCGHLRQPEVEKRCWRLGRSCTIRFTGRKALFRLSRKSTAVFAPSSLKARSKRGTPFKIEIIESSEKSERITFNSDSKQPCVGYLVALAAGLD